VQDRISCTDHAINLRWKIRKLPQISEVDKTRLEMQDCLQMPVIQNSTVIDKNEDGSDITH
jgi:hypothetical protein